MERPVRHQRVASGLVLADGVASPLVPFDNRQRPEASKAHAKSQPASTCKQLYRFHTRGRAKVFIEVELYDEF